MGINSKKIAYESNEPAFLRRLKGQFGGDSDRQERAIARPRKPKDVDYDDDEPTYVDEDSHETISKEQYEQMLNPKTDPASNLETKFNTGDRPKGDEEPKDSTTKAEPKKAIEASIGAKKRRLVKAVGIDEEEHADEDTTERPKKTTKKSAKKAQKVKLSFDDET